MKKKKPFLSQKRSVKLIEFWAWGRASLYESLLHPLPLPMDKII